MSTGSQCRDSSDCGLIGSGLTCAFGAGGPGAGGVCMPDNSAPTAKIACSNDGHCGMPGTGQSWCCKDGYCQDTRECWKFNCKNVQSSVKADHADHFGACVHAAVTAHAGKTGYGEGLYPAVSACVQECYPGAGPNAGAPEQRHIVSKPPKHGYFHENTWLTYGAYKF